MNVVKGFIKGVIINTILFIALAGLLRNSGAFYVASVGVAIVASLVLGILNTLIKPVLMLLSLPINILTLGLFSIVINGLMLQLTSYVVGADVFNFSSFGMAMFVAIVMSICNVVISRHFETFNEGE